MLDTVNNLGLLYYKQGRLKEAEDMYNRALRGYEKALRVPMVNTYPPALITMENLGNLLQHVGRSEEAQKYYLRAEGGVRLVYGSGSKRWLEIISKLRRLIHGHPALDIWAPEGTSSASSEP
ncbi:hypothetical protein S40285_10910 [Stachybotrys chlorohalonatus IBT 40285]|uniref:Uncharacterized protein n=1 Tax=Stachybotrys chlorohalonatus (strain IBT 40285) TaxID=1283841 RepID=A0A084QX84_STAC4|nr:hypothetical protein S40285_10910 [Stachybotrys chlorohalonata IBT 40285]